jgi:hypothetical protein
MKFQTPEGGCMWPHHVDSPICVYDRESYEKYKSGEYKVPTHCICGVELSYEKPVCVCLVENEQLNGEMLLTVEYPLTHVQLNLGDDVQKTADELQTYKIPERTQKKIKAEEDLKDQALKRALDGVEVKAPEAWEKAGESFGKMADASMGCRVPEESCVLCGEHLKRITVRCKHSGAALDAWGYRDGTIRWTCPCGFILKSSVEELPTLPDEIVIDDECRRKDWP